MSPQSLQSWTARFHYQLLAWCTADMYTRYMECRSVKTCGIQQVQQLIYKCNPCIFHPIKFKSLSGLSNYNPYSSVTHLQSHLYVHTSISTEKSSGQLMLYLSSGATLASYCHVQYLQQKDSEELITEVRNIDRDKLKHWLFIPSLVAWIHGYQRTSACRNLSFQCCHMGISIPETAVSLPDGVLVSKLSVSRNWTSSASPLPHRAAWSTPPLCVLYADWSLSFRYGKPTCQGEYS